MIRINKPRVLDEMVSMATRIRELRAHPVVLAFFALPFELQKVCRRDFHGDDWGTVGSLYSLPELERMAQGYARLVDMVDDAQPEIGDDIALTLANASAGVFLVAYKRVETEAVKRVDLNQLTSKSWLDRLAQAIAQTEKLETELNRGFGHGKPNY